LTLSFFEEAAAELRHAFAWYATRNVDAAARFGAEVRRIIDVIIEAPDRWPRDRRGFRKMLCARFPYSIVYRWDPANVTIVVVAIAHQHRRANYWSKR